MTASAKGKQFSWPELSTNRRVGEQRFWVGIIDQYHQLLQGCQSTSDKGLETTATTITKILLERREKGLETVLLSFRNASSLNFQHKRSTDKLYLSFQQKSSPA